MCTILRIEWLVILFSWQYFTSACHNCSWEWLHITSLDQTISLLDMLKPSKLLFYGYKLWHVRGEDMCSAAMHDNMTPNGSKWQHNKYNIYLENCMSVVCGSLWMQDASNFSWAYLSQALCLWVELQISVVTMEKDGARGSSSVSG